MSKQTHQREIGQDQAVRSREVAARYREKHKGLYHETLENAMEEAASGEKKLEDKELAKAGRVALKRLKKRISGYVWTGRIISFFYGVLSVAPYWALLQLGTILLTAYAQGSPVDTKAVERTLIILLITFMFRVFLYFVALLLTHVADMKLRHILRRTIVDRMSKAPLAFFTEQSSGLTRKLIQDDTKTVHIAVAHGPVELVAAVVAPLSLFAFLIYIDWRLALLGIATIPIYLLLYAGAMKDMNAKGAAMTSLLGKVSSAMVELVSGINVVKAFGKTGRAHENYEQACKNYTAAYIGWSLPFVSISSLAYVWASIPVIVLVNLGGGALMMNAGLVDLAQVLCATLIALVLPGAFVTVTTMAWNYQMAGSSAIAICEVMDTPPLPQVKGPGKEPQGHDIELKNVSYSYGDTKALDGVSLRMNEGTVTALLGPSGSGKSTLASLVARFGDPDVGTVRIGGVDLREMTEEKLYQTVAFVLQDAMLLRTSIRDNISLARPGSSLESIREAARRADIDDFIMGLPKQYDTVIGDDVDLSGGEQQRVAIARALLADRPILILDEATAFADPDSEAEIQRALQKLVKGRTVLVIAHRPSAIRGADKIVVLEKGKIRAEGRHEEIIHDPHYQMVLKQSLGEDAVAAALAASEGSKVGTGGRPATGDQPTAGEQPASGGQPVASEDPVTGGKPATGGQTEDDGQTTARSTEGGHDHER